MPENIYLIIVQLSKSKPKMKFY